TLRRPPTPPRFPYTTLFRSGVTPADRNVISGNGRNGITMDQVSDTFVYGNYIGLNATGLAALGNSQSGIGIFRGFLNFIGGPARSEEHTSELQSRENLVCRL